MLWEDGPVGDEHATFVLDGLPGAIVAVDLDDRVTVWNGGAERLCWWPANVIREIEQPFVHHRVRPVRKDFLDLSDCCHDLPRV